MQEVSQFLTRTSFRRFFFLLKIDDIFAGNRILTAAGVYKCRKFSKYITHVNSATAKRRTLVFSLFNFFLIYSLIRLE